jgi:hypothetical protein
MQRCSARLEFSAGRVKGRLGLKLAKALKTDMRMLLYGFLVTSPAEAPLIEPPSKIQIRKVRAQERRRSAENRKRIGRRRIGDGTNSAELSA